MWRLCRRSPVGALFAQPLPLLLATAVPERARDVSRLLRAHRVSFTSSAENGFRFYARGTATGTEIGISLRGVEMLWALCYFHAVVYSHYRDALARHAAMARPQRAVLDLSSDAPVRVAREVLTHAWDALRRPASAGRAWPSSLPGSVVGKREKSTPEYRAARDADALCHLALAWIFRHELSHIARGHLASGANRIAGEREADRDATEWLLGSVTRKPDVRDRAFGVAMGVLALVALRHGGRRRRPTTRSRTHPPAAERMTAALRHAKFTQVNDVLAFVVAGMAAHHDPTRIPVVHGSAAQLRALVDSWCDELTPPVDAPRPGGPP